MTRNTHVSRFTIKGDKLCKALNEALKKEVLKNIEISTFIKPNLGVGDKSLNLEMQKLSQVAFVSKYL